MFPKLRKFVEARLVRPVILAQRVQVPIKRGLIRYIEGVYKDNAWAT